MRPLSRVRSGNYPACWAGGKGYSTTGNQEFTAAATVLTCPIFGKLISETALLNGVVPQNRRRWKLRANYCHIEGIDGKNYSAAQFRVAGAVPGCRSCRKRRSCVDGGQPVAALGPAPPSSHHLGKKSGWNSMHDMADRPAIKGMPSRNIRTGAMASQVYATGGSSGETSARAHFIASIPFHRERSTVSNCSAVSAQPLWKFSCS